MQPTRFDCIYQANCDDIRLSQHGIENSERIKSIQFGLNGRVRVINNTEKEFFIDIKGFLLPSSYVTEQQIKDCVAKHYFIASFSSGYNLSALPIGPGGGQDYSTMKNKDGTPFKLSDNEKKDLEDLIKRAGDINKALVVCASAKWEEKTKHTYYQRKKQLETLFKLGADPNAIYEGSPLIFQAKDNSIFSLFIEAGVKWDVRNSRGESIFFHASSISGCKKVLPEIIYKAFTSNQKNLVLESKADLLLADLAYNFTDFDDIKCALECLKLIVKAGVNLETHYLGYTALESLVKKMSSKPSNVYLKEAIIFLCQHGANPNHEVPIYLDKKRKGTIFHKLISEGSQKNVEDSKHCIIEMIKGKIRPDLRKKDSLGIGILFKAAHLGWHDIFCFMVENGADPNEIHPTEGPILLSVVDPSCLECLIKANADLTVKNSSEKSFNHRIIQQSSILSPPVLNLLFDQKVNFNTLGSSLLFSFLKSKHPELKSLLERLLKIGFDLNDCYWENLSPLGFFLNQCINDNDWRPITKSILGMLLDAKVEIQKIPLHVHLILPLEIKQLLQVRVINDVRFLSFLSEISIKVIAGLRISYATLETSKKIEDIKALIISSLKTCPEAPAIWDGSRANSLATKKKFISYLSEKLDNYLSKSIFFDPARGVIDQSVASNFQEDMKAWFVEIKADFLEIRKQEKTKLELHKIEQELFNIRQSIEQSDQEKKQKFVQQLEEKVKVATAAITKVEEDRKVVSSRERVLQQKPPPQ